MLLAKLFIKDYQDVKNPHVRAAYGKLSSWVGIFCNVLLCTGKFVVGLLSGSISITADAMNNLSDASSGIISLMGFKLSERSPDKEHPYGHGRYEYLAGLMVALLILIIGIELLKSSVAKIITPEPVEFSWVTIAVLAASIVVKLLMMLFYRRTGKLINSETLFATAADSRNDVITTLVVLIAAIVSGFSGLNLDGIMGLLVACFILWSGVGLIREAISPLLGRAPEPELVESIRAKIMSYPGVLGTHDLMIHDYGPGRRFASVHVEMPADGNLTESHDVIDRIERDFLKDEGLNLLVHLDPIVTDESATGKIYRELTKIISRADNRLTLHDLRIIPDPSQIKVIFDCTVPQEITLSDAQIKEQITRLVSEAHEDYKCIITVDRGYAPITHDSEE
ncbi:MAG: cation diffusion facilitator family transporter [Oscillospiraceae bacterium]